MHAVQPEGDLSQQSKLLLTLEQLLAIPPGSVKATLDTASTLIAEAITADKVDIFLYDGEHHTLVAVGTSKTPMGEQQLALGLDRLPIANGGRTVEAYEIGKIYHNGHVELDLEELRGMREGLGICSQIAVPLLIDSARRGVLQSDAARPEAFSALDAQFLIAVAHWIGLIIQRAELVEQQIQAATEEARRRSAEEIITILAHDLRNHLTLLTTRSTMLQRRAEREGREKDSQQLVLLNVTIQRLVRMINNLLDANRLQEGVFQLNLAPVNVVDLVDEIVAALQHPHTPIEVHPSIDHLIIEADAERLSQALENLIVNAQRYSPTHRSVQLTIEQAFREDGPWVILGVHDKGPGIPPLQLEHLFKRFRAGPDSKGLGLGLYLVHEIAAAHGGAVTVDSHVGEGSTFRLEFPAAGPPIRP